MTDPNFGNFQNQVYADGGDIDSKNITMAKRVKVKKWYLKTYPTDDLGEEIRENLTFWSLWSMMSQGYNVYDVLDVSDSLVRERVFEELSKILGIDYDIIYQKWLNSDNYAKGGIIVTKIKDIPNLKDKVDKGQVTYRGLGAGKLADDFYKTAGQNGTRIKVDGQEYFITDEDFKELDWDFKNEKWMNKVKFNASARKYDIGGVVVADLAGHTGGSFGTDTPTLLSEYSGTYYSGLTGETGAMSVGEMFEAGGTLSDPTFLNAYSGTRYTGLVAETGALSSGELFEMGGGLPNGAQQNYVNYYLGATGILAEGGSLEAHGIEEGDTFIKTIAGNIQKVKDKDGKIVFINLSTGERDSQPPLPFKKGGSVDHKYLNHSQDYEVTYAKGKSRHGYGNVKYLGGGVVDGTLNKNVYDLASKSGFLISDWATSEYNLILAQALVESLTDANFHSEAKEVVAKLEKKPWSNELFKSKYFNPDNDVREFAIKVSQNCAYDGDDIVNAYYYLAKMQGSSVGNLIDDLFLSKSKTTGYRVKTSTDWWNTVVNPNEDFNNFDDKMPIDWEVDDFKSWVVSKSDLDGNVDKEVLDVVKMPKAKLTVDYLNKNGSGKNNDESYKKFGNWQSALYDIFTQMKKDYLASKSSSKSKKYIDHDDIVLINIKKGSKQLTYKAVDVLNGANILEKGGQLEKIANYIPIRDVISVDLKDGTQVKPSNGYWIKKDAKPYIVGKLGTFDEGGNLDKVKWQDVEKGDSARVKDDNKMGLVIKNYGRKFHLKFPNGTEKTFDASDLEFFKLEKDEYEMNDYGNFKKGGKVEEAIINKDGIRVRSVAQPKKKLTEAEWLAKHSESKEARSYKAGGDLSKYSEFIQYEFPASKRLANKFAKKYNLPFLVLVEKDNDDEIYIKEANGFYAFPKSYIDAHDVLYVTADKMAEGGVTFDEKSSSIANKFVGKAVEPKYQKEYGKVYSKEEANEVGDKIAGSMVAKEKMAKGGDFPDYGETVDAKDIDYDMKSYFNRTNKKLVITTKDNKKSNGSVTKFYNDLIFVTKEKHDIPLKDIRNVKILEEKMKKGGITNRGGIMLLAKQIRKENESWKDALKRAGEQLRK